MVEAGEEFGGEVEAGGRGGDGTFLFCVDRLVAFAVGFLGLALHVVWEGELADFVEIGWVVPADEPLTFVIRLDDGAGAGADFDGAARLHFFAGADEAPPV